MLVFQKIKIQPVKMSFRLSSLTLSLANLTWPVRTFYPNPLLEKILDLPLEILNLTVYFTSTLLVKIAAKLLAPCSIICVLMSGIPVFSYFYFLFFYFFNNKIAKIKIS